MNCRHSFVFLVMGLAAAGLLLGSCARIGAPPGGIEDKTGPKVVSSFPGNDSTNVPRKLVARLVFSKPVNHQSVQSALYMSPDPRQRLRYRWHGNTLDLIYLDSLAANRTYVISLGSQAKDLRGNPAGSSSTIAFSTGPRIDRGTIDGWVSDVASPQAVAVWAYELHGDTIPLPDSSDADYRLQVGSDFKFQFGYLKTGRYRLYAVMDRNFDGFWNPPTELLGIPPWDITVSDSTTPWIAFKLAMQDSAAPKLRGLRQVNEREVSVRVSRYVPTLTVRFASSSGDTVAQLDAFPDSAGSEVWRIFPSVSLVAGMWTVVARGTDPFGRGWSDAEDSLVVRARSDTVRPHVLRTEPLSKAPARTIPDAIRLMFDKPVMPDSLSAGDYRWLAGGDSDTVRLSPRLENPHTLALVPPAPFAAGKKYSLRFNGRAVRDYSGHTLSDTLVVFSMSILAPDSLGGVRGDLATKVPAQYLYRILAVKNHEEAASTIAPGPGEFHARMLPVGKYLLEVTRDVDRDSLYSYGRVWPFQFSEPFLTTSDTMSVRARWDYETRVIWRENP